ncbi:MAG: FCD domain-containing protein, partial [Comamonadaceae bacterium]|nr:FCD domain-containing protein [Comamonadaceae bacterium]
VYAASGNPLIVEAMQTHWQHLRRAMGEVLRRPALARKVWSEHADVLDAIAAGDAERAARTIAQHVRTARERVGAELASDERSAA